MRNKNIDFIKGLLVFLVFIGHIIPGILEETFPRYFIYSFHMPLFIGISGFLFNTNNFNLSFYKIIKKYFFRLVIPWLFAVVIYFFLTSVNYTVKDFILFILKPYYHLWFILGLLFYIFLSYFILNICKNIKYNLCLLFIFSLLISITAKFGLLGKIHFTNNKVSLLYSSALYDFRIYNFCWFVLGLLIKKYSDKFDKYIKYFRPLLLLLLYFNIVLFYHSNNIVNTGFYFVFNSTLLIVILLSCCNNIYPTNTYIEWMGKNSLAIYLYHVLCKLIAEHCFNTNSVYYYLLSFALFYILLILIYFLSKIKIIAKLFFGK